MKHITVHRINLKAESCSVFDLKKSGPQPAQPSSSQQPMGSTKLERRDSKSPPPDSASSESTVDGTVFAAFFYSGGSMVEDDRLVLTIGEAVMDLMPLHRLNGLPLLKCSSMRFLYLCLTCWMPFLRSYRVLPQESWSPDL
ncbi:hypothetical protein XENOCAPTIV_014404 [Xenoophorus captivus]|uniref:Uncharacterized protein n=1 Tax=Xenoophorus captivus TaxID=1517983 RepID=A0ABV0RZH1_9TELE